MASAGERPRPERVAAQIRRALALLLRREIKDPRVGNVTVTDVSVTPDLSVARVRVLPFGAVGASTAADSKGEAAAAEPMLQGLTSAAGYLRGQLARELSLRRTPRLIFELDQQLQRAHQLSELIDHAVAEDRAHDKHRDRER
jgi:ribosome-binding factor A